MRFIAKQNSLMKIGNNGNLVLGPFDESTPCLMIVLMNCQTKLRINHLTAVKSVAILETAPGGNRPSANRKVRCLQTIHLRENYEYWCEIHKREQEEEEAKKAALLSKEKKAEEEKQGGGEAEMETIEEEGASHRHFPPVSENCCLSTPQNHNNICNIKLDVFVTFLLTENLDDTKSMQYFVSFSPPDINPSL
ncbi:alpha-2 adrenergic receptor [Trichonephila clavipes]|nr:alpha-2 adrenergic receptor [Trichonephila clavipes]